MSSSSEGAPRPRSWSRLIRLLGYAASAAALVWVYWGFDWKSEVLKLASADWRWVAFAMVADVLTYIIQGWRWSLLLRPVAPAGLWRSAQAIFVGLFVNTVFPLRTGEVVRTYLQARWLELQFSVCLSSVVIERLLDGIVLVAGFYAVTSFVEVPRYLRDGSLIMTVVVGVLAVALGIVMFHKHHAHAAVSRSRWADKLWHVVEGLHAMGNSPSFVAAAALSIVYMASQLLPIYALARGLSLEVPVTQLAVVLVIMRVGTVLPEAPGNVGAFQFFIVLALQLFEVDKGVAAGFATMLFLVMTIPLLAGGAVAFAVTGIRIQDLQHHVRAGVPLPAGTRDQDQARS